MITTHRLSIALMFIGVTAALVATFPPVEWIAAIRHAINFYAV